MQTVKKSIIGATAAAGLFDSFRNERVGGDRVRRAGVLAYAGALRLSG